MVATMSTTDHSAEAWYLAHTARLNRCSHSPWVLACEDFQRDPRPVAIRHVLQEHGSFFALLDVIADPDERATVFHDYALSRFWLHEDRDTWPSERERLRHSYVSVLRGWGVDANGASGAVFKGWAESRFGLRCIYHGEPLDAAAAAREAFARERMRGWLAGIDLQLDLLYTYCQEEWRRRAPDERWLTLYRGTHDPEAYTVKSDDEGELVEFNTVSSFTEDREIAWEFGNRVWEVQVPLAKVVYFSGLLQQNLLQGEREYIVLGGDYRVRSLLW